MDLTAVPRGPYRTGRRRRQQIVEAATAAFARRGYAGASLREIADGVGVTTAGLLRHFGSKEELLTAVLDRWGQDTDELIDGAGVEGLEWFLQYPDLMRYHEEHPGLIELYLTICGEASDPGPSGKGLGRRSITNERSPSRRGNLGLARDDGTVRPMTDQQLEQEVACVVCAA